MKKKILLLIIMEKIILIVKKYRKMQLMKIWWNIMNMVRGGEKEFKDFNAEDIDKFNENNIGEENEEMELNAKENDEM